MIIGIAGNVMFLAIVFRHSLAWFLGCLFIPFIDLIYLVLNFKKTWKPMLISIFGLLVAGVGYSVGGFHFLQ